MNLTVGFLMTYNFIDGAFTYPGLVLLSRALLNRKGSGKKTALLAVPFCAFTALWGTVIYKTCGFSDIRVFLAYNYAFVLFWAVWMILVYREPLWDGAAAASFVLFLFNCAISMTAFFFTENADLSVPRELMIFAASDWFLELFFAAVFAAGIRYFRLGEAYRQLVFESASGDRWKKCSLFLVAFHNLSVYLINEKKILNNDNPMAALLLLLLLFCILNYGSRCEAQKKQLELQELSIRQQETYIAALEKVQREVRMFRHDYKNMLSGILVHTEDGDLKAVQEFLGDMADRFERQTGEDIRRMTQISNLKIPELKGLLLSKFSAMAQKGISCNLEISPGIENPGIPAYELCRMMGILVDNAMEAVEPLNEKKFDLILAKPGECILIVVKNPVASPVPLEKIWQEGYSTKGEGRGLGLASLNCILNSYDNVYASTFLEDGCFVQEIKIVLGKKEEERT